MPLLNKNLCDLASKIQNVDNYESAIDILQKYHIPIEGQYGLCITRCIELLDLFLKNSESQSPLNFFNYIALNHFPSVSLYFLPYLNNLLFRMISMIYLFSLLIQQHPSIYMKWYVMSLIVCL